MRKKGKKGKERRIERKEGKGREEGRERGREEFSFVCSYWSLSPHVGTILIVECAPNAPSTVH